MLESPRHEVGPARGLASGQQRTTAHAPFPAASSSTAAPLGSFLYANRPCQKRSRDPPRGGAAKPELRGEGAGAETELAPRSPTARTWLTPHAARTSALTWTPGCTHSRACTSATPQPEFQLRSQEVCGAPRDSERLLQPTPGCGIIHLLGTFPSTCELT